MDNPARLFGIRREQRQRKLGRDAVAAKSTTTVTIVPILLPIAQSVYGIDPFHFGVVICINIVLGLLTPPVGTGLYIASAAAGIAPARVFAAFLPFLATTVLVLILLSWQPWLVTLLVR